MLYWLQGFSIEDNRKSLKFRKQGSLTANSSLECIYKHTETKYLYHNYINLIFILVVPQFGNGRCPILFLDPFTIRSIEVAQCALKFGLNYPWMYQQAMVFTTFKAKRLSWYNGIQVGRMSVVGGWQWCGRSEVFHIFSGGKFKISRLGSLWYHRPF